MSTTAMPLPGDCAPTEPRAAARVRSSRARPPEMCVARARRRLWTMFVGRQPRRQ
jgi:hypothetical protein